MTLQMSTKAIADYLDESIRYWRNSKDHSAIYYVDAFQSIRLSLFGRELE